MQSSLIITDTVISSEPIELDPSLWAEVVGGTPKNTWSTVQAGTPKNTWSTSDVSSEG